MPWAGWVATIYHGLPVDLHRFEPGPGDYLLFLGRLSPEKRVDRAIEISDRTGIPLRIVGKIDPSEAAYFADVVVPLLAHPLVEFLGELSDDEKEDQLAGALALLFPIDWPEPFGLVMIEAMACGTPVVAFRCGAAPEIVDDGVTGAIVESVDEAVVAVERVAGMDRTACRRRFEERFSVRRMVDDHEALYVRLVESAQDLYHLHRHTTAAPDPGTGTSWPS
jgi:glycosyltransferase involved in cell wall biosynthesis